MSATGEPRYQTVARVGDLAEGQGMRCEVEGRAIALFLDDGRYYALEDVCPHQGLPLHDGIVADCTVSCLAHDWQFGLKDGHHAENPRFRVGTFPVRVVEGAIQVDLS